MLLPAPRVQLAGHLAFKYPACVSTLCVCAHAYVQVHVHTRVFLRCQVEIESADSMDGQTLCSGPLRDGHGNRAGKD